MALLWAENDYRIIHNVACIYGQLSATDPARQRQHEDIAIALLDRAMEFSRSSWSSLSEADLIAAETVAFPPALRKRAEFQQLLSMSPAASPSAAPGASAAGGATASRAERRE